MKGLTCISPEQTTWAAPLWLHVPPGQGTLGQTRSSGSSPSHLNCSAQTRALDSLKSSCPRTDTALPHPSSAQMTWAVGSVKFPSDTGIQASPEYTSTRPEQGPSPPARRTNPKRKQQQNQWVFMVLTWQLETAHHRQWYERFFFFSRSGACRESLTVSVLIEFSWAAFWREIQKGYRVSLAWLNPKNMHFETG